MSDLNLAVLRFSHPLAFRAYLKERGAPVDGYFRRQGLPTLCDDPGAFVPLSKAWRFYGDAAQREDPHLGWQVGHFVGDNRLSGSLLKKLERAPTLYQALQRFCRLINSEVSYIRMGILERRSDVLFYSHFPYFGSQHGYLVSQGYQLAVVIDVIRHFAGRNWAPAEIGTQGGGEATTVQARYPHSRIKLNQPFGYISIPRSHLHRDLCKPHHIDQTAEQLVWAENMDYAQLLELLLEPYLQKGYPSMNIAASLMDQSTRTVARRLAKCGTSYHTLQDSLRYRKATDLLNNTDMPISEVAWCVGFDDQSNFGRMFRRNAGVSPLQFRRINSIS